MQSSFPKPDRKLTERLLQNGSATVWTYGGAKVNAEIYNTAIVVYKYLSDNPVTGKAKLNILKWNEFSTGTYMTSREDIAEGKWAVVSYDMSTAKDNALAGKRI